MTMRTMFIAILFSLLYTGVCAHAGVIDISGSVAGATVYSVTADGSLSATVVSSATIDIATATYVSLQIVSVSPTYQIDGPLKDMTVMPKLTISGANIASGTTLEFYSRAAPFCASRNMAVITQISDLGIFYLDQRAWGRFMSLEFQFLATLTRRDYYVYVWIK